MRTKFAGYARQDADRKSLRIPVSFSPSLIVRSLTMAAGILLVAALSLTHPVAAADLSGLFNFVFIFGFAVVFCLAERKGTLTLSTDELILAREKGEPRSFAWGDVKTILFVQPPCLVALDQNGKTLFSASYEAKSEFLLTAALRSCSPELYIYRLKKASWVFAAIVTSGTVAFAFRLFHEAHTAAGWFWLYFGVLVAVAVGTDWCVERWARRQPLAPVGSLAGVILSLTLGRLPDGVVAFTYADDAPKRLAGIWPWKPIALLAWTGVLLCLSVLCLWRQLASSSTLFGIAAFAVVWIYWSQRADLSARQSTLAPFLHDRLIVDGSALYFEHNGVAHFVSQAAWTELGPGKALPCLDFVTEIGQFSIILELMVETSVSTASRASLQSAAS